MSEYKYGERREERDGQPINVIFDTPDFLCYTFRKPLGVTPDELFSTVRELAELEFHAKGELQLKGYAVVADPDGLRRMACIEVKNATNSAKDRLVHALRMFCDPPIKALEIGQGCKTEAVFILSEAWKVHYEKDEQRPRGSLADDPRRTEALLFTGQRRGHPHEVWMAEITRNPTNVATWAKADDGTGEGRLVGFFPGDHGKPQTP